MERAFNILGFKIRLAGPEPVVNPIATAYARFACEDSDRDKAVLLEIGNGEHAEIRVKDRSVPIIPGIDTGVQVYQQFLAVLLSNIRSHAILHGATVASPDGKGILVAAPAGHGKSSITLALVDRGYLFLGDDYAPLDLENGSITPYPRAISLIPGGELPVPDDFREAALDRSAVRLFGKALIDVGTVRGEEIVAKEPVPLRNVMILTSSGSSWDTWNSPTLLDVGSRLADSGELDESLRSLRGVIIEKSVAVAGMHFWRLRLNHSENPTGPLTRVLEREAVVFLEKYWEGSPDFDRTPTASRIKRRHAAEILGREILNRRGDSGILWRYRGDTTAMFLDLAASLRQSECFRIETGRFRETVDLIQSLAAGHSAMTDIKEH